MKTLVSTEVPASWRQPATLQYLCLLLASELIHHVPPYTTPTANLTSFIATCFLKGPQTHNSRLHEQGEQELNPPTPKQWKKPGRCCLHLEYKPKPRQTALKLWLSELPSDAPVQQDAFTSAAVMVVCTSPYFQLGIHWLFSIFT